MTLQRLLLNAIKNIYDQRVIMITITALRAHRHTGLPMVNGHIRWHASSTAQFQQICNNKSTVQLECEELQQLQHQRRKDVDPMKLCPALHPNACWHVKAALDKAKKGTAMEEECYSVLRAFGQCYICHHIDEYMTTLSNLGVGTNLLQWHCTVQGGFFMEA